MKLNIRKILVPTDFSELSLDALDGAVFIAKKLKAEICLLHVFENSVLNSTFEKVLSLNRSKDATLREVADHQFENIKKRLKTDVGITCLTGTGRVHSVIADTAAEIDADIIVMSTHGVSGFDKFLLGSTSNRVISASECPVITFTANPTNPGLDKILLPLDLSRETREKVDAAIQLAKNFNAAIDVIGIVSDYSDEAKLKVQLRQVENYIKEVDVVCHAEIIKSDDEIATIVDYSTKNKIDLIMIMTNDESITDFFISSESQKIINNSPIPVCSIRPRLRKLGSFKEW